MQRHVTLNTSPSGLDIKHELLLVNINKHTKFEVPVFTGSKDMRVSQNLKLDHFALTTPIRGYFVIPSLELDTAPHLSTKLDHSSFSRSRDIIMASKIKKMGHVTHVTLTTPFYSARNARIASAVLAIAIPSVRLSVCPSHAGIVSKRRHVARCSLHCWIAKCV